MLLPLNDLQGEIRGLVGTNVLDKQLQTGQMDRPTIQAAVKDSGAIDVTLEEGEDNAMSVQAGNYQDAECNNTKCHQGTQTEISAFLITDIVIHEPVEETHL